MVYTQSSASCYSSTLRVIQDIAPQRYTTQRGYLGPGDLGMSQIWDAWEPKGDFGGLGSRTSPN